MGELKMILQPYSDTIVSLLCFSSRSFALWSTLVDSNDPLYAFCPLVSYWQSFDQPLQNKSQVGVKISRHCMKAKKCPKVFSLFCYIMLENCEDCIETYSVWTRPTVCPMSMPISYSMLETIINDKLWTLQWKTISCWTWSTAYWQVLDDMG